jgi:hypothetical protein
MVRSVFIRFVARVDQLFLLCVLITTFRIGFFSRVRDVAVIHPTVQTMLNVKMSSRFPTMILMLDFYFLTAVISVFSLTVLESINRRFNQLNTTAESRSVSGALLSPLYIGVLYFLGREITQMVSRQTIVSL